MKSEGEEQTVVTDVREFLPGESFHKERNIINEPHSHYPGFNYSKQRPQGYRSTRFTHKHTRTHMNTCTHRHTHTLQPIPVQPNVQ